MNCSKQNTLQIMPYSNYTSEEKFQHLGTLRYKRDTKRKETLSLVLEKQSAFIHHFSKTAIHQRKLNGKHKVLYKHLDFL